VGVFSVKKVEGDGNSLFRSLENLTCYFVLRDVIADAETVVYCVEYYRQILWNSAGTYRSSSIYGDVRCWTYFIWVYIGLTKSRTFRKAKG
jgi:hypothetical protein